MKKNKVGGSSDFVLPNFKIFYKAIEIQTVWFWHIDRCTDQWNRTASPKINPDRYTKINSKWINSRNIKAKTIKILKENIGINLHNLGFGDGFLDMTPMNEKQNKK